MTAVKTFMFNSLSVSTGLIIYSFFVYLAYLLFFNSKEEEKKIENEGEKISDKIDNFDILEDVE